MKLNLGNLINQNSNDSAANNVSATAFTLSGFGNLQTQVENESSDSTTFTNNASAQPTNNEPTFTFTFTNNETYNLDDIVYKKRRDNADCPLILNVKTDDQDDEAVLAQITKLILSDYGIGYTDENYKTQIAYVPLFEEVFTNYFNTYYPIFDRQRADVNEGSISLVSVLEQIVSYHESLVNGYVGDDAKTYANSNSYNKPQVEWEYGTVYDNALSEDITSFLPDVVNLFSLREIDGKMYIVYDGIVIPNSGVTITTATGTGTDARIESTTRFVNYPIDVSGYDGFQAVRIVTFVTRIKNLFTSAVTTFGSQQEE